MKKKSKSVLAIVLAILLLLIIAVTLTTNILFSRKDTPKLFGHYIYLMESDVMEADGGTAVATGVASLDDSTATGASEESTNPAVSVDSTSAAASIHKNSAVIVTAYDESDPIAKNNAVLCVLGADDTSTDVDSDRIAVRRIYNIEQDETGVLKYYPTTMQTNAVGTEPAITVDNILGKCTYESGELYSFIQFATGVPGILTLLVLPSVILVIMLIVTIAKANSSRSDEFAFEESYDDVYGEDSHDSDADYDAEELGARSPLFRPGDTASNNRSFEQKRSSIAQNFERKAVNPNSPYQKARTMQFKAQHDVPIYTNPNDQIPLGGANTYGTSNFEAPTQSTRGNTTIFSTRDVSSSYGTTTHAAAEAPDPSSYRGSHVAESPDQARNLGGASRPIASRPAPAPKPVEPKPTANSANNKYDTASVDDLLAMIESEKKKLDK